MYAGGDQEGKMGIPVKNRTDQFAESNRSFFESNKSTEPLGFPPRLCCFCKESKRFPVPGTNHLAICIPQYFVDNHNNMLTTTISCGNPSQHS